jgi:hypothetical protein
MPKPEVLKLMKTLNISEAEALELMAEDKAIDRGEKLHELPKELEAGAKKARRADRKRSGPIKRERKVDETKKQLLAVCQTPLEGLGAVVLEVKTETEILFQFEGDTYTLKLTKHRPSKS